MTRLDRTHRSIPLVLVGLGLALPGLAVADSDERPPPSIVTSGHAELSKAPEIARLDIAVVTEGKSADKAAKENAQRSSAVAKALEKVSGKSAKVSTEGYGVSPSYNWDKGKRILLGYTARNTVRVETRELDQIGALLDAAIEAGANEVTSLQFALDDDTSLRASALALATRRAMDKADAIAGAADLEIAGVLEIREEGLQVGPRPMESMMMRAQEADATPIAPDDVTVRAGVTVRLEIRR